MDVIADQSTKFLETYFNYSPLVGIVLGILIMGMYLCFILRRSEISRITSSQIIVGVLFSIYVVLLLGTTILNRNYLVKVYLNLDLFWSYKKALFEGNRALLIQILFNILAFLPFGILFPSICEKVTSVWKMAMAAALFSLVIELTQFAFEFGLCELDDIFSNTLGALLGYTLYHIGSKIWKRRL